MQTPSWSNFEEGRLLCQNVGGSQLFRHSCDVDVFLTHDKAENEIVSVRKFVRPSAAGLEQLEFETRFVVDHINMSTVETGDGRNETEAKPISGGAATAFKLLEAPEDILTFFDGEFPVRHRRQK